MNEFRKQAGLRPKVLLVEDEPSSRLIFSEYLSNHDLDVAVAADGDEGLAMFESFEPCVVVTDVRMPKRDGLSMLAEIKKIRPDCQVIVMSAVTVGESAKALIESGAFAYLPKPVSPEMLLKVVVRAHSPTRMGEGEKPRSPADAKSTVSGTAEIDTQAKRRLDEIEIIRSAARTTLKGLKLEMEQLRAEANSACKALEEETLRSAERQKQFEEVAREIIQERELEIDALREANDALMLEVQKLGTQASDDAERIELRRSLEGAREAGRQFAELAKIQQQTLQTLQERLQGAERARLEEAEARAAAERELEDAQAKLGGQACGIARSADHAKTTTRMRMQTLLEKAFDRITELEGKYNSMEGDGGKRRDLEDREALKEAQERIARLEKELSDSVQLATFFRDRAMERIDEEDESSSAASREKVDLAVTLLEGIAPHSLLFDPSGRVIWSSSAALRNLGLCNGFEFGHMAAEIPPLQAVIPMLNSILGAREGTCEQDVGIVVGDVAQEFRARAAWIEGNGAASFVALTLDRASKYRKPLRPAAEKELDVEEQDLVEELSSVRILCEILFQQAPEESDGREIARSALAQISALTERIMNTP